MSPMGNKSVLAASAIVMSVFLFSACDNEIDLDNGNVSQHELNREKYHGISMEFWSGKEVHWEQGLWGGGVAVNGHITAFRISFAKCDPLYATVPMLKDVEITANGILCNLKDMLADRYDEDIYLKSVTLTERGVSTTVSGDDLKYEWNYISFGRCMKISFSQLDYYFPANPSNSPRDFILTVSYSGDWKSPEDPDSLYHPEFDLRFRQLGNSNHINTIN